ncbi:MAG: hypothetical protein UY70_C0035G0011 [Candidatus Kaiserbacteria bacterium GW2011_GWB1_52_6]|uniref:Carbonic anhydrase n=3 Tax=Candidatus Kaiseribacteriota TaxID=1752734 RepID=A0A0G2AB97_9BACT|nr:MAG: hypothetical protein UY67_C0037G0002 [Candidatus Kaiserbacteria bacterium GW2011_GWA2_52_12]KKW26154.1 MAG: hypothetical protein UY70_C0035G0011 [Candidatus Kaiserbacteria bacterium GW2011_GWB1_52_6]KKW29649.1 MAG: hypothetical protein UY74_C0067G0010 [Candidatus Kaiserbacteria bacterium GW2011_GWC2_52_8b]
MSSHGTFCTVFDCMDGRTNDLVNAWCRTNFGVDHPDTITIAGCDGILISDAGERERAFKLARISAHHHGSKQAVVIGHSECAGHMVPNEQHKIDIEQATKLVAAPGIFEHVVGLFVDVRTGEIVEVCRI